MTATDIAADATKPPRPIAPATRVLARIWGPLLLVFALMMALRGEAFGYVADMALRDPALTFVLGFVVLVCGLIAVALHNLWRTPGEIAISLLGWATAAKGAALLLAPDPIAGLAAPILALPFLFLVVGAFLLALGGWVTFIGFAAQRSLP
jgi:hypothetical protein